MFRYMHRVAYAIFPALVPTPQEAIPPKPKASDAFQERLDNARSDLADLHVRRAQLRGDEKRLQTMITEYELSLDFFKKREESDSSSPIGAT